jgi:hypothetical protein
MASQLEPRRHPCSGHGAYLPPRAAQFREDLRFVAGRLSLFIVDGPTSKLNYGQSSVLLEGDAERAVEGRIAAPYHPNVDLLRAV